MEQLEARLLLALCDGIHAVNDHLSVNIDRGQTTFSPSQLLQNDKGDGNRITSFGNPAHGALGGSSDDRTYTLDQEITTSRMFGGDAFTYEIARDERLEAPLHVLSIDGRGQTCLSSFDWQVVNPTSVIAGGQITSGTPTAAEIQLSMPSSAAAEGILNAVSGDRSFLADSATITTIDRRGRIQSEWDLTNVLFTSFQRTFSDQALATTDFSLSFDEIVLTRNKYDANEDRSPEASTLSWDFKQNARGDENSALAFPIKDNPPTVDLGLKAGDRSVGLASFGFDVGTTKSNGGGSTKVEFSEVNATLFDQTAGTGSLLLLDRLLLGRSFGKIELFKQAAANATDGQESTTRQISDQVTLHDAFVTSWNTSDNPTNDSFTLSYSKIEIATVPKNENGKFTEGSAVGIDRLMKKAFNATAINVRDAADASTADLTDGFFVSFKDNSLADIPVARSDWSLHGPTTAKADATAGEFILLTEGTNRATPGIVGSLLADSNFVQVDLVSHLGVEQARRWTLSNAMVTSYSYDASADPATRVAEAFTLSTDRVEQVFTDLSGKKTAEFKAEFDFVQNKGPDVPFQTEDAAAGLTLNLAPDEKEEANFINLGVESFQWSINSGFERLPGQRGSPEVATHSGFGLFARE